jgi:hypothetical protein
VQDSAACGSGSFAFTWHPQAGFRSFLIHITVRNLLGLNQARENNLVLVENIALCFFDVNMAGGRQIARRTLRLSVPRCGNVMGWSCSSWGAKPQDTGRLLFSEVRRSLGTPCLDIVWINLESFLHIMYNIYIFGKFGLEGTPPERAHCMQSIYCARSYQKQVQRWRTKSGPTKKRHGN